ncbi:MAG TPA: hypothetical protein VFV37_02315 [Luteibaculaceae bacterium]|nr:hypothetical protein [Luteibaculaceae bacterium]
MKSFAAGCLLIVTCTSVLAQRISPVHPYVQQDHQLKPAVWPQLIDDSDTLPQSGSALSRKMFQEPLLHYRDSVAELRIFPLFRLQAGREAYNQPDSFLYLNSRGLALEGSLGKRLFFQSTWYESQAKFPTFYRDFVASTGSVPGFGRTKAFKTNGFDFPVVSGLLAYKAASFFTIWAGNGRQKMGLGYRSLWLSDFANPYPYYRFQFQSKDGRWRLDDIRAQLNSGRRFPSFATIEPGFIPREAAFHLLSFGRRSVERVELGLFMGSIFNRFQNNTLTPMQASFFVPLPALPSLLAPQEQVSNRYGFQMAVNVGANLDLYSQAFVEMKQAFGTQLGLLWSGQRTLRWSLRAEVNLADAGPSTPLPAGNYTHANHTLAHPLGDNFLEALFAAYLQYKRFYFDATVSLSEVNNAKLPSPKRFFGARPTADLAHFPNEPHQRAIADLRLGCLVNPSTQTRVYIGLLQRVVSSPVASPAGVPKAVTQFWSIGLSTDLSNFTNVF